MEGRGGGRSRRLDPWPQAAAAKVTGGLQAGRPKCQPGSHSTYCALLALNGCALYTIQSKTNAHQQSPWKEASRHGKTYLSFTINIPIC